MNAATLANPDTAQAFVDLIELLANPAQHKKAVEELKKLVEESRAALEQAQEAQADADANLQSARQIVWEAQDIRTRNARDLADIAVRKKQLDDHAEVLSRRQADLETYDKRSRDEFNSRERKILERERQVKQQSDELDEFAEAMAERDQALAKREADIAAAEARLREIVGLTQNFTLEAETGRPFTRMGGA